ncbi:MAG: alanine--tRNA ligase, partial [Clostridia bacterium]|nr:alanine--tRNA ligase [Clostridia bacterium]
AGQATILALWQDQAAVPRLTAGEQGIAILDETPFYAEAGGQVGDSGWLTWPGGRATVDDAQAVGGRTWHRVRVEAGELTTGQKVEAQVDGKRRAAIARHHSATHLLHRALREILGLHVQQAGSLVDAERLRFDFSHFDPLSPAEIQAVERLVNEKILAALPVEVKETTLEEAKAMGALALFQEKYGTRVRLVRMGDFSLELCGGTHVRNTAEIGLFKITAEGGIGAGIRRLEAVAGTAALDFLAAREGEWEALATLLKVPPEQVRSKVAGLLETLRQQERVIARLQAQLSRYQLAELLGQAREVDGVRVLAAQVEGADAATLRDLADT